MIQSVVYTPNSVYQEQSSILNRPSSFEEAKAYWQNTLKNEETLILCEHCTNPNAITALLDVIPCFAIEVLDLTECTFAYEAFAALINCPDKPNGEWELPWLPLEQLIEISPEFFEEGIDIFTHPKTIFLYRSKECHYLKLIKGP